MRLQVTKRTDYAIGACALLAASAACPVSSRRIAAAMGIPAAFLPQVLADLQRAGLVESRSGKAGGYCLARDPRELSILELVEAVEGPVGPAEAADGAATTPSALELAIAPTWASAREAFSSVLARTSLAEVAQRWATSEPNARPFGRVAGPMSPERIPA